MNQEIINNMKKHENNLSKYACKDSQAIRFQKANKDIRTDFFRDIDKIIYSLSYIRYIDKTQVFSKEENDMISRRMLHVQLVSKIARTIGRCLSLNEDLIEASSLGHDLGHPPFGHCGEEILNKLSMENGEGVFQHNVESVRTLMTLENNGLGKNISIQVLDAILCHNGEILLEKYAPTFKTKDMFIEEYNSCYKDKNISKKLKPMTLEGCVVRISDIIAYIGMDIEDAARMNIINSNIPKSIRDILGNNNREIVNTLILDIVNNSYNKPYIKLSKNVFNALQELIKFNYENIYNKVNKEKEINYYKEMYETLFNHYKNVLENSIKSSDIYKVFLDNMDSSYINNTSNIRKVIDYIAGMTDDYFVNRYNEIKIER
mgnify:FL=1